MTASMKEIGGYIELDLRTDGICPQQGVMLNSGRNALRYIVRSLGIRRLLVPCYTCHTVHDALQEEPQCEIQYYELDEELSPCVALQKDEFILYNNYFGVIGRKVADLAAKFKNLIVDNSQALYARPQGVASFYSPRKFFGLPDGGIAVCPRIPDVEFEMEHSVERMKHLLLRIDYDAATGYADCKKAALRGFPIRSMSRLTQALLKNIDYDFAKRRRLSNFNFYESNLHTSFPIDLELDDVPMCYPLVTNNPELRRCLIENRIYVPIYWPNVKANQDLAEHILPLPLDQRYDLDDLSRVVEVVKRFNG